ncbi:putative sugar nucleotidyl transferase [Parasegetibacter sp. NRK P23]|uniref:putative sugar nucleotidyl transferase n=1 Tax=Parasegetibacter sp. NRK P23 TaxID=2942999 RepID=UPI002043CA6C|nr:putative sugar nucleotidyl transferase [Parasegetibacter sp. NRK P23]MCM5530656.1 glucose-1-phosphate thymidylyltransferase [Parasegetibacter sp. NRK P23]
MQLLFTEEYCRPERLFPFTATRPIQDLRIGILTIREKWELLLNCTSSDKTSDYYKDHSGSVTISPDMPYADALLIHGNVIPTPALAKAVLSLVPGQGLSLTGYGGFAFRFNAAFITGKHSFRVAELKEFTEENPNVLEHPRQLFEWNDRCIRNDFSLLSSNRISAVPDASNRITTPENIFMEEGAVVLHSILNASTGPIYIGKNAQVMEGCLIRGPFALGEGAVLKMGTRVYGATTIGPYCTGGGEIKNSIMMGYSNKAHDGYLGDSVIGHWCNLGAGTSNSNLKNNTSPVKLWNHPGAEADLAGSMKCGLMMGDYARAAINTSFNTGTVVGVGANVFGGDALTPKFIPSFAWGSEGIERYRFDKFLEDIKGWKAFKGKKLGEHEVNILKHIFDKEP